MHEPDKFHDCGLILHICRVHLLSHGRMHQLRHALTHLDPVSVFLKDLLMGMNVTVAAPAAGIDAAMVFPTVRQDSPVRGHHVGPDLIHIRGVGIVHHIRRIASCRTHVDLQAHKIADFSQAFSGFRQAEKFQMYEPAPHIKSLYRSAQCH